MYIFDSRERKNEHIKAYFDRNGIAYRVEKLDVGDYMIEGGNVSIDRKQNLSELATNLMNRADKARFWREVRRAREQGIKLIVLCEHGGKVKNIQSVAQWSSPYSQVSGKDLMREIYRVHISYGVDFIFCSKRSTGKKIVELLTETVDLQKEV